MLIAQISDLHVTVPGQSPGDGVDSTANLTRAIAAINALDPQPDVVIASGDLVEWGTDTEYARLRDLLATLRAPCRLMAGNHDDRAALLRAFPSCKPSLGVDGLQQVVDVGPLQLILLDSLVPGTASGTLGSHRLAWLDARLTETGVRPAMVFVHHPPIETGVPQVDDSRLSDGVELAALCVRHRNVVRVACGHLHRQVFCAWAGTTLSVCPSTAHQFHFDLRPGGRLRAVAGSPAFQLHRWQHDSLQTFTILL
jgi:3',5'-cyclic-AMP phosphodiesterase